MAISPDVGIPDAGVPEPERGGVPGEPVPLRPSDVIKTYRYLRIGLVAAVVLLFTAILIEHGRTATDCWQRSISAYYYTPVRAIFVGALMAVGLSLIVYKGRSPGEDPFLNFAGMLAPVVAIVPTNDVGVCYSIPPEPLPKTADGSPAGWVIANIDNNYKALLITGALGLLAAAFIALVVNRKDIMGAARDQLLTTVSLIGTGLVLVAAWWAIENWGSFYTKAHSWAAIAMFVMLIGAIVAVTLDSRDRGAFWFWTYAAIAAAMVIGALVIVLTRAFGEHTTFALETYEIALFAVYWVTQTVEKWNEEVNPATVTVTVGVAPSPGAAPSGLVP
ncbi:MAG TPA: hypothetical protein VH479_05465 [Acidimicrobiales bacterium]|jgi:hypothetical protein